MALASRLSQFARRDNLVKFNWRGKHGDTHVTESLGVHATHGVAPVRGADGSIDVEETLERVKKSLSSAGVRRARDREVVLRFAKTQLVARKSREADGQQHE